MSQRAIEYVLNLGSDRVTVAQKLVLLAIAEHHSDRYGTADVAIGDLGDDAIRSPRQLRRIFKKLEHLIEYRPGVGSGNYSQFRFVEMVTKGTERGHKGDICATAIKEEDLNLSQNQKQNQHGSAELDASCNPKTAKAIYAWTGIKTCLQLSLASHEFSQWVRPTYLLRVMGDCLLLTHHLMGGSPKNCAPPQSCSAWCAKLAIVEQNLRSIPTITSCKSWPKDSLMYMTQLHQH
jgi:hypothetical protein